MKRLNSIDELLLSQLHRHLELSVLCLRSVAWSVWVGVQSSNSISQACIDCEFHLWCLRDTIVQRVNFKNKLFVHDWVDVLNLLLVECFVEDLLRNI